VFKEKDGTRPNWNCTSASSSTGMYHSAETIGTSKEGDDHSIHQMEEVSFAQKDISGQETKKGRC